MRRLGCVVAGMGLAMVSSGAWGQVRLDRADPTISEQALPLDARKLELPQPPVFTADAAPTAVASSATARSRVAAAIIIRGGEASLPREAFADILPGFIARDLSTADLSALVGAISARARSRGFPFAFAAVPAQTMEGGILRITLDLGRIDAVRVIGAINPHADRLLSHALAGQVVRTDALERAIGLIADIPGITVKDSKFVRQDGFGILLVTIAQDRASAYAQFDNRGSREVGPIRGTFLGSVRGVFRSGDEIGLVAANTPLQPSEFSFLRARYTMPVGATGSVVSLSGSYGRANPGASLRPLDVVGKSWDVAMAYAASVLRSRSRSLWATAELRTLSSKQDLLGSKIRDDRLTILTGGLNGNARLAHGVVRGDLALAAGLPIGDVTRRGDAFRSRRDGDARFVTVAYNVEWARPVAKHVSVAFASAGQVASRPLLAAVEIGAGGPAFGRGYDYAERTGDYGILGSAELRADIGRVAPGIVDRVQLYGFVDGGHVDNLRRGIGGGSLLSTGAGARLGRGRLDGMVELALPINADRFDTGNRRPRLSFRLSSSF